MVLVPAETLRAFAVVVKTACVHLGLCMVLNTLNVRLVKAMMVDRKSFPSLAVPQTILVPSDLVQTSLGTCGGRYSLFDRLMRPVLLIPGLVALVTTSGGRLRP